VVHRENRCTTPQTAFQTFSPTSVHEHPNTTTNRGVSETREQDDSTNPRWTAENRQFVDRSKPAIFPAAETSEFYFVASSVRKSVWTFVRQLRGPHLSTCA
jgi:hypothetical protein